MTGQGGAGIRGRGNYRPLAADRGSGSVLAVALLGAIVTVTVVLVPVLGLLSVGQSVRLAADAAALAAADTASGLVPGIPCEAALRAAVLNAAQLSQCTVDGLIVTVTVTRTAGAFTVPGRARAGPPDEPRAGRPVSR